MSVEAQLVCIHDSNNPQLDQIVPADSHDFLDLFAPISNKQMEKSPMLTFMKPLMDIYRDHSSDLGLEDVEKSLTPLFTGALWNVKERHSLDFVWRMWNENDQISFTFHINMDFFEGQYEYRPVVVNVVPDGTEGRFRDSLFLPSSIRSTTDQFLHVCILRSFVDMPDMPVDISIKAGMIKANRGGFSVIDHMLRLQTTADRTNVNFRNVLASLQDRFWKHPETYKVAYTIMGLVADTSLCTNQSFYILLNIDP